MDHYREITKRGLLHLPTLRQLLKWDEFHVPLYFVSLTYIFLNWNDRELLFTFSLDLYIQISSKNQIWEALPEREKHYVQPKKHHGGNLPEVPATGVMVKYINQMCQEEVKSVGKRGDVLIKCVPKRGDMCIKCVGKRVDSVSCVGKRVICISNMLAKGVICVSNVLARGVDMRIRSVRYRKYGLM